MKNLDEFKKENKKKNKPKRIKSKFDFNNILLGNIDSLAKTIDKNDKKEKFNLLK